MKFKFLFTLALCWLSSSAFATEVTTHPSPTGSLLKMILGLMLVLGVMAGVAYLVRRMLPGVGHQQSAIHVVGSASVGTRERVVVLEIGGRWLVVGVAPGHVSAIANLDKSIAAEAEDDNANTLETGSAAQVVDTQTLTSSFGKILKSSASKFTEKTNG